MTRFIGQELTADLFKRLSPEQLSEHAHKVILIMTIDEDKFPHPAMLSHFEIVARDKQHLRLTTYADSRTTANMRRNGLLSIVMVDKGLVYYLKGTVEEIQSTMVSAPHNALFDFHILSVNADEADVAREGETHITSGITFDDATVQDKITRATSIYAEMLA